MKRRVEKKYFRLTLILLGVLVFLILLGLSNNVLLSPSSFGSNLGGCIDSDGGKDGYISGETCVSSSETGAENNCVVDYCINGQELIEYYCDSSGKRQEERINCGLDGLCVDGRCLGATGDGHDLDISINPRVDSFDNVIWDGESSYSVGSSSGPSFGSGSDSESSFSGSSQGNSGSFP